MHTPARAALDAVHWNLSAEAVETASFEAIDALCAPTSPPEHWTVVRRLVHTSGDPELAALVRFGCPPHNAHDPILAGLAALRRRAPLFCDSSMIRSGISLARLRTLNPDYGPDDLVCCIADPDVAARAAETGHTRALCAAEKVIPRLEGGIVLIGNAPLALARICQAILEDGVRPALLIAMPVGFVNVLESKALLEFCPVPHITIEGRRGGSPLAVAALHAVCQTADEHGL